jgi:hypothetical protein
MKPTSTLIVAGASCLALTAMFSPVAFATDLYDNPADVITADNSLDQLGREGRNQTQQTWDPVTSGEAAYPGPTTTTTDFNYITVTFTPAELGNGQYVQINIQEPNGDADLFASAWTGLYTGTASVQSGTGWLGDAGTSGDSQFSNIPPIPIDPAFFNVTVPAGDSLTVVINTTSPTAIGETFGLEVEAFSSTDYTDSVPEPSVVAMLGAGLVFGGAAAYRRRRRTA